MIDEPKPPLLTDPCPACGGRDVKAVVFGPEGDRIDHQDGRSCVFLHRSDADPERA